MLAASYRGLICDLDGVVYRGHSALPGAIETLRRAEQQGLLLAFATNNASRSPREIRQHLSELGLARTAAIIVTSAGAAAAYVAERFPVGTDVLAVGGPGVPLALTEAGLHPVTPGQSADLPPVVVQGAGADVSWTDLTEASYAIQSGSMWVATNADMTIPTSRGIAPGNGTLVSAVASATGTWPVVIGKPEPTLFQCALDQLGLPKDEVLVVGDRLDTDVAAANALGMDSLWVLSGAHGRDDLAKATADRLPTHFAADLRGLLEQPRPVS